VIHETPVQVFFFPDDVESFDEFDRFFIDFSGSKGAEGHSVVLLGAVRYVDHSNT
jgi:hypothetical protein